MKFIYIVRTGTYNSYTQKFSLYNYYYTSLKKANELKDEILSECKLSDVKNSLGIEINKENIYAVDFVNRDSNTQRIIIEKKRVY
jgi:hypothetical protein